MAYNCIQCDFDKFTLRGLERIGSESWQALLECNKCWTSQTIRLQGRLEKEVRKSLRELLRPRKSRYTVQERWAYDFDLSSGQYDFSKKRPIRKIQNDF